jgi:hypothetical protein
MPLTIEAARLGCGVYATLVCKHYGQFEALEPGQRP